LQDSDELSALFAIQARQSCNREEGLRTPCGAVTHILGRYNLRALTREDRPITSQSDIQITTHDVLLAGLPASLSGITLVQISDLHRGCGRTDELIQEAVRLANAQEPDITVVTGDFIDHRKRDIAPVAGVVSELRARRRVYGILGNHDYRGDARLLTCELEAAGIQMLNDRSVEVEPGLWLAGIEDLLVGKPDVRQALESVPPEAALVFLSHNPNILKRKLPDRPMLILSGHTHGGQFDIPFPTAKMICLWHLRTPYVHGWFTRGRARMYVNRGIGVTGMWPFCRRIRCAPEISVFRLLAEDT
jgi:uncharacterized protein